MPMNFIDARPAQHQGNLPFDTLKAIMNNSIYDKKLNFGVYNSSNATITVTNGAHEGTFYPGYGNYYFDIKVNADGNIYHCLIKNPSDKNNQVLAVM